jgi:hypothetical protein
MTVHGLGHGSGPGASDGPHTDVGAYVLGVLDDDAMTCFERHLAMCTECGQHLEELAGLVPVLSELAPPGAGLPEPPGGEAILERLVSEVAADRRRRRSRRWLTLAAAAVLIAGGPAIAVIAAQNHSVPHQRVATGTPHTGSDPATGVKATVATSSEKWGTQVTLTLSGVKGPIASCRLVAIGKDSTRQVVSTWSVPGSSYGTTGRAAPLEITGGAGLPVSGISRFDVVTSAGRRLVSVPM